MEALIAGARDLGCTEIGMLVRPRTRPSPFDTTLIHAGRGGRFALV
jgi:aspartate/glutamate racemase